MRRDETSEGARNTWQLAVSSPPPPEAGGTITNNAPQNTGTDDVRFGGRAMTGRVCFLHVHLCSGRLCEQFSPHRGGRVSAEQKRARMQRPRTGARGKNWSSLRQDLAKSEKVKRIDWDRGRFRSRGFVSEGGWAIFPHRGSGAF